jgi:hypothetical protein
MKDDPSGYWKMIGVRIKYTDDQPRDYHGRFASTGAEGEAGSSGPSTHLNRVAPTREMADRMINAAKNGGFTLDFRTMAPVNEGYAVGVFPQHSGVFDANKVTTDEVSSWLKDNAGKLNDPRLKVGGWVDEGKLWLDIVRVYNSKDLAVSVGAKKNQIAIADLGAIRKGDWDHAFINTGGTGKMVKQNSRKPTMLLFDHDVKAEVILDAVRKANK